MEPIAPYENILATKGISPATIAVWDHINAYNQPVVIVVDSNKQKPGGGTKLSSSRIILHYIVIRGIRESSSTRYFSVYNPADSVYPLEYTEKELMSIMTLSGATDPPWVYEYACNIVYPPYRTDPAYILTVQGD
jgi:hypothetical protein